MTCNVRIMIVGGYGTFGGRLVELLEDEPRLTVLVAGPSIERSRAYCAKRTAARATLVPTAYDRINSQHLALADLHVTLVVDASGPFQAYGNERYRLIESCIKCGVNYLDLADASAFVSGVSAFDEAARAAQVYVLSGVSSFPVLTAAVVRHLSGELAHITSIRGGIAPSPYAGVGLNVIRAIASYAGQPIALKRAGRTVTAYPLTESMRFVIAVPGHIPLTRLRFSLVDVPDLTTLAEIWPESGEVWMGAGPLPALLHWALTGFAWMVRMRLMPTLSWMASLIYFVTNHLRWGEHRGGMFVAVEGQTSDGSKVTREWHLLAEGRDGLFVPSMAVEALVRKSLAGQIPPAGARTAISDVSLLDYQPLFARRTIFTGIWQRLPVATQPLFQLVLRDAFELLPSALQQLHTIKGQSLYSGLCRVKQGSNPVARIVMALFGFPKPACEVPITVRLYQEGASERWVRSVADRSFSSQMSRGVGPSEGLIRERFGPIAIDMALVSQGPTLGYVIRRWSLFGIPMPLWLGPSTIATEYADAQGRFRFDVELRHPFLGLLTHYAGSLSPTDQAAS
jgi:hypothetical protein